MKLSNPVGYYESIAVFGLCVQVERQIKGLKDGTIGVDDVTVRLFCDMHTYCLSIVWFMGRLPVYIAAN